jgi:hypothetical protein
MTASDASDSSSSDSDNEHPPSPSTRPLKPPINAIANGNWIGYLPSQFAAANISRSEEQAVAIVILNIYITTVISNDARVLQSHHYMIKNPNPIVRSLQNDIAGYIRFALVGCNVTEALALIRKRFPLRVQLVRDFLDWLDTNNSIYQEHNHNQLQQCSPDQFSERNFIVDRTLGSDNPVSDKLVRLMQFSTSSYNNGTADDATTGASTSTIHPRTGRSPTSSSSDSSVDVEEITHHHMILQTDTPASSTSLRTPPQPVTDVIAFQSNNFFPLRGMASLPYAFPLLFPYGVGGYVTRHLLSFLYRNYIKYLTKFSFSRFSTFLPFHTHSHTRHSGPHLGSIRHGDIYN